MLLAAAARRMGIAEKLAAVIPDRRDPTRVVHPLPEILLARILAIACGYEDADDLDSLRTDPAFKLACGRLPESGVDLMSQPTVSRWENAPTLRDLVRLGRVMVDLYCASYATPPEAVVLDIDDTVDVVHGHQQLSLFNAHYDERCFLPIHVYDTATGRPVAMILRPGKTPSGVEVRGHVRRLVRAIRRHWPTTSITIRGDGHYCRPEVMDWCEANGVDYVFGLTGTKALAAKVEAVADDIRVERAIEDKDAVRGFAETTHAAKSWKQAAPRRRPHRSDAARSRHPLRRHQHRERHGRMALCRPLLRTRPGREPDQAAQGPARLRPHQLPGRDRQPDAARPSHRRLLAGPCRARRHPQGPCPRQGRVHDDPAPAAEGRRPRHRDRQPGAHRLRQRLPGRRPLPPPGRLDQVRRALSGGASGPRPNPLRLSNAFQKSRHSRGEKHAAQNRDRLHATANAIPKSERS